MKRRSITRTMVAGVALLAAPIAAAQAQDLGVKNIVLVHGAWADGSGWREIHDILEKDGYDVSVVGNPLTSLADDVAAVDRVLARLDGPAILVGHSYGGAVITEAGDDPKVVGLVYVEAFVPDVGESIFDLIPKDGPQPPIEPSADGFVFFNKDAYVVAFAAGIDPALARFMADAQVPLAIEAGNTPLTAAAWKTKPSWYQVGSADQIIPPDAERLMAGRAGSTVVEAAGGHLAFMASPQDTADLIETAARASAK